MRCSVPNQLNKLNLVELGFQKSKSKTRKAIAYSWVVDDGPKSEKSKKARYLDKKKGKDVDCWKIRGVERIKMKSMRCEKTKVVMVME